MFTISRLNHAVLWVRDARVALDFYREVLGFTVVESMGDRAYFLRASGSENHHDLGLFGIGAGAPPPSRANASASTTSRGRSRRFLTSPAPARCSRTPARSPVSPTTAAA